MSMNSWTSPLPSDLILPISSEMRSPRAPTLSLRASRIWRMTSPRLGPGMLRTARAASALLAMAARVSSGVAVWTRAMTSPVVGQWLSTTGPLPPHLPSYTPAMGASVGRPRAESTPEARDERAREPMAMGILRSGSVVRGRRRIMVAAVCSRVVYIPR